LTEVGSVMTSGVHWSYLLYNSGWRVWAETVVISFREVSIQRIPMFCKYCGLSFTRSEESTDEFLKQRYGKLSHFHGKGSLTRHDHYAKDVNLLLLFARTGILVLKPAQVA
jgi:hypothetical protein